MTTQLDNDQIEIITEFITEARDLIDEVEPDILTLEDVISDDELSPEAVDDLNRILIGRLHQDMKRDPEQIEPAVHCFSASRHLERIADLAENIAEDVIYLIEGDIVRHQHGLLESETPPIKTD